MSINNTPLPPLADPTSLQLATQLLAALSDPEGTKARLGALRDAQDAYGLAKKEHDAAKAAADVGATKLATLEADKAALADDRAEHERAVLALSVAADANSRRSRELDERERAIEAGAADLQRRTAAHDARLKEFRDTLLAG